MCKIAAGALFVLLMAMGVYISSQRPLWNDEYYSLTGSINAHSYGQILTGNVGEGNNSPLFYVLQKLQLDAFSYHMPREWLSGQELGYHRYDWIFLRLQSVIFVSAALCALFYFFARRHSWLAGAYALAVAMTSSLLWVHWTEARPYAEWFSLSLFQILLLIRILENPGKEDKKEWVYLIVVHCLLALTASGSVVQIMAAGIVLWVFQRRAMAWFLGMVLVPVGIGYFYYLHAPHYGYFFVNGPVELINASIPKDRLFIIFTAAIILFFQYRPKTWMACLEIKFLTFLLFMLGAFGLILLKLKHDQVPASHGFQISSRYFIPLLPAGIVGTVLFSIYVVRIFPSKVWKAMMMAILLCFLVFRFHKLTEQVPINQILSGHSATYDF